VIAIIPNPTPTAVDLALLRLDLTDEQRERDTRIGEHGPEALRPPARKAAR
jgi:hypothetical protein